MKGVAGGGHLSREAVEAAAAEFAAFEQEALSVKAPPEPAPAVRGAGRPGRLRVAGAAVTGHRQGAGR